MNAERLIGLAYVCERRHAGQWSREYRLLCKVNWKPGTNNAAKLLPRDEWREARMWAAHYTKWMRRSE